MKSVLECLGRELRMRLPPLHNHERRLSLTQDGHAFPTEGDFPFLSFVMRPQLRPSSDVPIPASDANLLYSYPVTSLPLSVVLFITK